MVAINRANAEAFVADPPSGLRLFLLYGSDAGAITERARRIEAIALKRGGGDVALRLGSDELSGSPGRIADEAYATSMFGGEPVISLRILDGRHNVAGAVAPLLERPPDAAWLIVEAGELGTSSPLRRAFESSSAAAAIPAFDAEPAEVGALIKSMAQDAGVVIDPDAFELLLMQLGADRLAIRNEMEKLFLYVGDGGRLTAEDVADLVGEVAAARADRIVDSALLGDAATVETELLRLASEGGSAASVASQGLRHLLALQSMRQTVEGGRSAREAIERARPPVFFRRKPAVEAALRAWSTEGLRDARSGLAAAVLQSRLQPALEFAVVSAALQRIAARAGATRAGAGNRRLSS